MRIFLTLRLRKVAIDADKRGDHALASLITEAIRELEK